MKKDILINFILTVLSNIILFIQSRYFIQYMGIETLGIIKLFTQFLAYLNIIEMGLGSASAFALYKQLADKDYKSISIVVCTIESIYNKIAILLVILGLFCIPIIPFFVKTSNFSSNIIFYWILYILNTASTYFFVKYIILFTANQEFLYVRIVQSFSKFIFQLLQIFFIVKYSSLYIYIFLLILDNITQWILFKIHYKNKYIYIYKTRERFNGIKKDIKNLFWHKLGTLIVFNTDLILISKFTSLEIVGIYASYQMIFQILRILVGILTSVLSPKIGNFIAKNNKTEIYDTFKKLDIFYCFMSLFLTFCLYNLINDFIILWLGKDFLLSKFTLKLICFNMFVELFRGNLTNFKEGAGFFYDVKSPIFESAINFIVSVI